MPTPQVSRVPWSSDMTFAAPVGQDRILDLVSHVYTAAADPAAWPRFLEAFTQAIGARSSTILHFHLDDTDVGVTSAVGFEDRFTAAYLEHFHREDPWREQLAGLAPGTLSGLEALLPSAELKRTGFYADWYGAQGLLSGFGSNVGVGERSVTSWSAMMPEARQAIGERELQLARLLMPHVRRALQIHERLHAADLQASAHAHVLERMKHGVIVTDGHARVLFANRVAERLLRRSGALTVRQGILDAGDRRLRERFAGLIRSAGSPGHAAAPGPSAGGALALSDPSGERTLSALVCPCPSGDAFDRTGRVLVFVNAPADAPVPVAGALQALYGLTPAESRVLSQLLEGYSITEVAQRSGTSIDTVRTHVRRMIDKAGVRRLVDLLRVASTDPIARIASGPPSDDD